MATIEDIKIISPCVCRFSTTASPPQQTAVEVNERTCSRMSWAFWWRSSVTQLLVVVNVVYSP
jgi:hypothetical protein